MASCLDFLSAFVAAPPQSAWS